MTVISVVTSIVLGASAFSPATASAPPGAMYVALGSSYASGPGIPPVVDATCGRSGANYPNRVAKALGYSLVDRTCSGAKTSNILTEPQRTRSGASVPPQIDAVTPDTKLVTITIGGNDVAYMNRILADSRGPGPEPTLLDYGKLEAAMISVVGAVRLRAPEARVVLVDYLPLVSQNACAGVPLSAAGAESAVRVHRAVVDATAVAAGISGADLVQASRLGAAHAACAQDPWLTGIRGGNAAGYHPNARGMAAIGQQIVRQIG